MKIVELLDKSTEPLISYEIIPPKRGSSAQQIMKIVSDLVEHEPPFIDVTSHSAQVYYEELTDGSWMRHVKRKRPGTLGLCAAIKHRFNIEPVPHLLCHGFTREETEDALIELNYLGIQNIMALRGDEIQVEKRVSSDRSVNEYAGDLVEQVRDMNSGQFLEDIIDGTPTDFCVGVAGYPEKHFEAPNLTWDILNLKRKVDAGAQYVTTQMFFDNAHYFNFVERCRDVGINVPIIPGLKILTSKKQLQMLPKRFFLEIPEALAAEVEEAKPEHVVDVGVEWAIRQAEELMNANLPCVHFYILQKADIVKRVVSRLRGQKLSSH
ncbi:MAG: methylenetetrahydrofolate reductase [NAD(P)H] [Rhodothermales bacterium]